MYANENKITTPSIFLGYTVSSIITGVGRVPHDVVANGLDCNISKPSSSFKFTITFILGPSKKV